MEKNITNLTEQELQTAYFSALEQYFVQTMQVEQIAEAIKIIQQEILNRKRKDVPTVGLPKLKNLNLPQMKQLNKQIIQSDYTDPFRK